MKRKRNKKFNFKKFLLFILFLIIIVSSIIYIPKLKVKNIIILNNNYYSDEVIIEKSGLENYPKLLNVSKSKIKKNLKELDLIEKTNVSRSFNGTIKIEVFEKKILYFDRSNELYITSNGKYKLDNVLGIPTLINYVPSEVETKFINKFKDIDVDIIAAISEIEYNKSEYDNNRFLLTMNDGNQVFVTTSKLELLNKYIDIVKNLNDKKGILYLDSGNYFEVKK